MQCRLLSQLGHSLVYYVFFTTATILASVSLFQGFYDTDSIQIISVFCGFFTIFIGGETSSRSSLYVIRQRSKRLLTLHNNLPIVFMLNSKRDSSHELPKSARTSVALRNGGMNGHAVDGDRVALVSESHLLKTFDEESMDGEDV